MIKDIEKCRKCGLCCNQTPLLDNIRNCDIVWVGLSAKRKQKDDELPLSPSTNSGMIIKKVEDQFEDLQSYKTNIVKCLPLDKNNKLRYPNTQEIDICFDNIKEEISELSPKVVLLLGEKVIKSFVRNYKISFIKWEDYNFSYVKYDDVYYVPVQHPSYIYVYKRKYIEDYVIGIKKVIESILNKPHMA